MDRADEIAAEIITCSCFTSCPVCSQQKEEIANALRQARLEGNQEMLDSIRASLAGYPHCGGDLVVMQHVDRIKREAVHKALFEQGA